MNSTIFKNNIAELEARINTLESKNSELKTSNQLLLSLARHNDPPFGQQEWPTYTNLFFSFCHPPL